MVTCPRSPQAHKPNLSILITSRLRIPMQRKFLSIITVTLFAAFALPCFSADRPALLSQAEIHRYHLERAWYSQIQIDGRMTTIEYALLDRGMMFIVTSNSDLIALDAETGKTLWTRSVSQSKLKPYAPAANTRTVALVCGNEVSVFDRRNGRLLWHQVLPATPTTACQLTDRFLYVPLIDHRMACFPMEELEAPSPALLGLVEDYAKINYKLDPYSGKVTKTSNEIVDTSKFVISQKGEKKPAPSEALSKLVPEYAKIGMILDPYTGSIKAIDGPVNVTDIQVDSPLKGKKELDEILAEELRRLNQIRRQELLSEKTGTASEKTGADPDAPYFLKPYNKTPLVCYSFGTTQVQPVISYESADTEALTWFSDRGYLFIAHASREPEKSRQFALQYRIAVAPVLSYMKESKIGRFEGSIARDVAFQPAVVQKIPDDDSSRFLAVVGSASGFVFAYDPKTSETRWWQSIGSPISGRPTVVKDKIYVPCLDGNFCCLDSKNGNVLWQSPGIVSFIAASPDWVYAKNTSGELVAIDPKDGAQTTLFSIKAFKDAYYNNENDRIYLISDSGLVQCLHEVGRNEPARHTYLPDEYLDYKETSEELRQLITMPEIPGGVRQQPRQTPKKPDSSKTQSPPESADDSLFGQEEALFEESPPSTTAPVTPDVPEQQPQEDDFNFDFGGF